jgi:NAD(P)-dependent dehydrogenase (short-subunit alcohol dehydrogenase family)
MQLGAVPADNLEKHEMRLEGKVAFVAGATTGIGKTTAELFAREGAKVIVAGRRIAEGEAVVSGIQESGGEARFVQTDVSELASVERAMRFTVDAYGGLHVLFNNAGGSSNADGKITESAIDEFWRVITLDLFGTFLCCRLAIPEMIKSGGGSIVNNASMVALKGELNRAAYTSAKGGVVALTRSIAADFMADRIRANAIAPGAVATERILAMIEASAAARKAVEAQPLGLIEPLEIAALAVFLASDESRSITGEVFPIRAGR